MSDCTGVGRHSFTEVSSKLFCRSPFLLRSNTTSTRTLMVKQLSKDALDGDSPGIPVQAALKSGPTGSYQVSIAFGIAVERGNHFRISSPARIMRQEKAVFPIPDHLWNPPCTGGDDRQAKGVGLTEHYRGTISSGGHQQKIGPYEELF